MIIFYEARFFIKYISKQRTSKNGKDARFAFKTYIYKFTYYMN